MDLGIAGKRAVVCASSKGLGRGCAEALAGAGVNLVINARGARGAGGGGGGDKNGGLWRQGSGDCG